LEAKDRIVTDLSEKILALQKAKEDAEMSANLALMALEKQRLSALKADSDARTDLL
jgi:hypothetical protein